VSSANQTREKFTSFSPRVPYISPVKIDRYASPAVPPQHVPTTTHSGQHSPMAKPVALSPASMGYHQRTASRGARKTSSPDSQPLWPIGGQLEIVRETERLPPSKYVHIPPMFLEDPDMHSTSPGRVLETNTSTSSPPRPPTPQAEQTPRRRLGNLNNLSVKSIHSPAVEVLEKTPELASRIRERVPLLNVDFGVRSLADELDAETDAKFTLRVQVLPSGELKLVAKEEGVTPNSLLGDAAASASTHDVIEFILDEEAAEGDAKEDSSAELGIESLLDPHPEDVDPFGKQSIGRLDIQDHNSNLDEEIKVPELSPRSPNPTVHLYLEPPPPGSPAPSSQRPTSFTTLDSPHSQAYEFTSTSSTVDELCALIKWFLNLRKGPCVAGRIVDPLMGLRNDEDSQNMETWEWVIVKHAASRFGNAHPTRLNATAQGLEWNATPEDVPSCGKDSKKFLPWEKMVAIVPGRKRALWQKQGLQSLPAEATFSIGSEERMLHLEVQPRLDKRRYDSLTSQEQRSLALRMWQTIPIVLRGMAQRACDFAWVPNDGEDEKSASQSYEAWIEKHNTPLAQCFEAIQYLLMKAILVLHTLVTINQLRAGNAVKSSSGSQSPKSSDKLLSNLFTPDWVEECIQWLTQSQTDSDFKQRKRLLTLKRRLFDPIYVDL